MRQESWPHFWEAGHTPCLGSIVELALVVGARVRRSQGMRSQGVSVAQPLIGYEVAWVKR